MEGKKIRRSAWPSDVSTYNHKDYALMNYDVLSDDWEILLEPKKQVTMYKMNSIQELKSLIGQVENFWLKDQFYLWITKNIFMVSESVTYDTQTIHLYKNEFEDLKLSRDHACALKMGEYIFKAFAEHEKQETFFGELHTHTAYVLAIR